MKQKYEKSKKSSLYCRCPKFVFLAFMDFPSVNKKYVVEWNCHRCLRKSIVSDVNGIELSRQLMLLKVEVSAIL